MLNDGKIVGNVESDIGIGCSSSAMPESCPLSLSANAAATVAVVVVVVVSVTGDGVLSMAGMSFCRLALGSESSIVVAMVVSAVA